MKTLLNEVQQTEHSHCIVCGPCNEQGLRLDFNVCQDGSVEACFECSTHLEGYESVVHGGILSTLLDGAMTNCLFAHGIKALTAELKVRFLAPVYTKDVVRLRASIQRSFSRFYILKSELTQNNIVKTRASAKFVKFA